MRHQHVAKIVCQPFRYLASERKLLVATRMRVTVHLDESERGLLSGRTSGPAPVDRPEWEGIYSAALLNADQSRAWRRSPGTPRALADVRYYNHRYDG